MSAADANHPLLKFFSYTRHPDIDVSVRPEKPWGVLLPVPAAEVPPLPMSLRPV